MSTRSTPTYYQELANGVEPLTEDERRWCRRLAYTLQACPSERLALVTIGDPDFTVIDETYRRKRDLDECDGGAEKQGFALAEIPGGPLVHGVSG